MPGSKSPISSCAQSCVCSISYHSTRKFYSLQTECVGNKCIVPEVLGEVWGDGGGVLNCRAPTAACAMAPLCACPRKCSWHASSSEHSTCSYTPQRPCRAAVFHLFYFELLCCIPSLPFSSPPFPSPPLPSLSLPALPAPSLPFLTCSCLDSLMLPFSFLST